MKFPIICLCLILSGCSWFEKIIPVAIEVPESKIFHPPTPSKLNLIKPEPWKVYPEGTTTEETVYAITPNGYEVMAINLQEIRRYIKDLQDLLTYYRNIETDSISTEQTP